MAAFFPARLGVRLGGAAGSTAAAAAVFVRRTDSTSFSPVLSLVVMP